MEAFAAYDVEATFASVREDLNDLHVGPGGVFADTAELIRRGILLVFGGHANVGSDGNRLARQSDRETELEKVGAMLYGGVAGRTLGPLTTSGARGGTTEIGAQDGMTGKHGATALAPHCHLHETIQTKRTNGEPVVIFVIIALDFTRQKTHLSFRISGLRKWWQGPESNRGHKDFQSSALPTEIPCQIRVG
jgi:hypothetical protein